MHTFFHFKLFQEGKVRLSDDSIFNHHSYCMLAGVDEGTHSLNLNLAVCYDDDDETKPEIDTTQHQVIFPICMHLSILEFKYCNECNCLIWLRKYFF